MGKIIVILALPEAVRNAMGFTKQGGKLNDVTRVTVVARKLRHFRTGSRVYLLQPVCVPHVWLLAAFQQLQVIRRR